MVCIQCVKRSRKNEVRTYHRGPFHRASQSVYCTCGDQWAGGNGDIKQFDTIAENLISDSIESVQLAPDGVVTDIYPAEGNEAGKIDLLHDKDRGRISCYARDNHTIITQGPFELKQGSYGIAVRNPVYLNDEHGQAYFWGFTIVILRVKSEK